MNEKGKTQFVFNVNTAFVLLIRGQTYYSGNTYRYMH